MLEQEPVLIDRERSCKFGFTEIGGIPHRPASSPPHARAHIINARRAQRYGTAAGATSAELRNDGEKVICKRGRKIADA